jgi:C_GCAxxG_C_C family probable redox protein
MAKSDKALAKFSAGYNCAQSVLDAFSEDLGLGQDTALKLATGFGAGMGREGEVCGAVTGGILALGSRFGRGTHEDRSATEVTYAKTRELMSRFVLDHGTCLCRELLQGIDLTTDEGRKAFADGDLFNKVCKPCVCSAAEITAELMS